jgi:hypothetical protein
MLVLSWMYGSRWASGAMVRLAVRFGAQECDAPVAAVVMPTGVWR